MSEQELKKILKETAPKTSVDFTDNLMDQLLSEEKVIKKPAVFPWRPFVYLAVFSSILILLAVFYPNDGISYRSFSLTFSPLMIPIFSGVFILGQLYVIVKTSLYSRYVN
ncbi:hypothetical protein [Marinigracilibium pacificum]|uniref:Uncharacterized protein n=1 Tax=Marinigracilibium pacificum TaxID=2729599 RepID=A0A848IX85_9BACT|nr:hypothetical protein [Marinigracilibium pacificum]NMM47895.1 hypothetical protein [Marinigracilibium pacificum]